MRFFKENKLFFIIAFLVRNVFVKLMIRKRVKLTQQEKDILKVLKRDGIVTIPNYFDEVQCREIKSEHDKFTEQHSFHCEENENRIFGIDKLSNKVDAMFSKDRLSWNICEAYLGEKMKLQTTMSARIDYKNGLEYGSGGSWHRDSFSSQIKSISYLTDMTDENGPFMYVKGSHTLWSIIKVLFKLQKKGVKANYPRYTTGEIGTVCELLGTEVSYFPCNKGTLVLADIRGLHTTRYLKGGFAYSIFNYYIAKLDHNENGPIKKLEFKCISGSFSAHK